MSFRLRSVAAIVATAGMVFTGACSGGGGTAAAKGDGVLTLANVTGGQWDCGFNPYSLSTNSLSSGNIYEPLVFVNTLQNQKSSPWLATDWAWSNGNKTLTFTIRDGVKWTDGKPMTAADVLFTFTLLKKFPALDTNAIWSALAKVERSGTDKIALEFKNAAVPMFYYIATQVPIVPEHVWSRFEDPVKELVKAPVGTGAYTVKQCTPQNITYTANPAYWQPGLPKVKTVRYPAFAANDPANTYLATGQAQWGSQYIPNIESFFLKRSPDHHHWSPPIASVVLFPNYKVVPLNDPAVRKALAYATDRTKAARIGTGGQQRPGNQLGVATPTFQDWVDPATRSGDLYEYDPAKAAATLEAAGYRKGADGIFVSPQRQEADAARHQPRRLQRLGGDPQGGRRRDEGGRHRPGRGQPVRRRLRRSDLQGQVRTRLLRAHRRPGPVLRVPPVAAHEEHRADRQGRGDQLRPVQRASHRQAAGRLRDHHRPRRAEADRRAAPTDHAR